MAEYILKKLSKEKNLNIEVKSAGTAGNPSYNIYGALAEVFNEEGIDYSNHISKPVSKELLDWADMVLVMENEHKKFIEKFYPEYKNKVFLLTEYAKDKGEIPDPIGMSKLFYRETFDRIKELIIKIFGE